jgi:hypothetical protein
MTQLLIDFNAVVTLNGLDTLMAKIKKAPSTDKVLGLTAVVVTIPIGIASTFSLE